MSTAPNPASDAEDDGDDPSDPIDGLLRAWFRSDGDAADDPRRDDYGNYRLLEPLGQGGMGQVFLAEQLAPVQRQVALKILRADLTSADALARFRAEQQALARMNHDNIARVFDAGQSRGGRPFFVMERIDGQPLRGHCDRRRLSVRDRLRLFAEVCAGVEHAHDNGVLHRDLKNSNVLVAEQGERATPKIIDFGLARALDLPTGARAAWSRSGAVFGTPSHMSPEQANGAATLTPAADVYALGVMLFELLTGSLPLADLDRDTPASAQQRISREEPPPPSQRLRQHGTAAIAEARANSVSGLVAELQGPLDRIVLRALQKEPECRYPSPATLAQDLRNFLADRPIRARPDAWSTRWRKWRRRHPDLHRGLWLGASVGGALTLLLLPLLSPLWRPAAARSHETIHGEPTTDPSRVDLMAGPGSRETPSAAQREALEQALAQHRKRIEARGRDPGVAAEVAVSQVEIGDAQRRLGRRGEADDTLTAALAALDALLVGPEAPPALRGQRGRARDGLSRLARDRGNLSAALAHARAATADLLTAMAGDARFRRPLAHANGHLVEVLCELSAHQEALAAADDSLRLMQAQATEADAAHAIADAVQARYGRALALNGLRRFEEAKATLIEGITIADAAKSASPDRETRHRLAFSLRLLSRLEQKLAKMQDEGPAGDYARRAIAVFRQLIDDSPLDADAWLGIASTELLLADFRQHARDFAQAIAHDRAGIAAAQEGLRIDPNHRRCEDWIGWLVLHAGRIHLEQGEPDAALALARSVAGHAGAGWGSARVLADAVAALAAAGGDPALLAALDDEVLAALRAWVPTANNPAAEVIPQNRYARLRDRQDFNALAPAPKAHHDDRTEPATIAARWVHGQTEAELEALAGSGWRIIDFEIETTAPRRFAAALVQAGNAPSRAARWFGDTDEAGSKAAGWPNTFMALDYAPFGNGRYACVLGTPSGTGHIWQPVQTREQVLQTAATHRSRPWSITIVGDPKRGELGVTSIGNHQWNFRVWRLTTAPAAQLAAHMQDGFALGDLVRWPDDTITCIETRPAVAGQRLLLDQTAAELATAVGDGAFRVTAFSTHTRAGQCRYDAVLRPNH